MGMKLYEESDIQNLANIIREKNGTSETYTISQMDNAVEGLNNFSGDYNDLTNKPTLGTASPKDVASSGDASATQVVMGNDSRLTDRRGSTWGQINGTLSNQTDLNNSINSLQGQIDTFTALTDGSTTGDAELTNIRVDSTGHTYPTAGDAVRAIDSQVNAMKTGFDGVTYASPAAMVRGCDQKLQDEIDDLSDDVSLINNLLELTDSPWVGVSPTIYNYSAANVGTLTDYDLELTSGQTVSGNTRVGCMILFNDQSFVGKKLILKPKYSCSGELTAFKFNVSKQSGNDGEYSILNSDINNPEILLDFTHATYNGLRYYYFYFYVDGKGVTLSQNSEIEYLEDYDISYYGESDFKRIANLESDVSVVNDNLITDKLTINLVDVNAIEHNYYYRASDGARDGGSNYLSSTGLIEVEAGATYTMNRLQSTQPQWTFWNESEEFVVGIANNQYSVTVPTGQNIKYMRVSILMSEESTVMIVKGSSVDYNNYFEYGQPAKYVRTQWYGKKANYIGDSLTQMGYWEPMLSSILGLGSYETFAQSGGNMIAIANYIENVGSDVDFVTVWVGTNDFANDVPLGSFGSTDQNTYAGALGKLINWLGTNRPLTKLLLITPMQRFDSVVSSWETDDRGNYINPTTNKTLEDYVNMVISYGDAFAIPVLDMYHCSGVNKYNITSYTNDSLHPTKPGFQRICWQIIEKLKGI